MYLLLTSDHKPTCRKQQQLGLIIIDKPVTIDVQGFNQLHVHIVHIDVINLNTLLCDENNLLIIHPLKPVDPVVLSFTVLDNFHCVRDSVGHGYEFNGVSCALQGKDLIVRGEFDGLHNA